MDVLQCILSGIAGTFMMTFFITVGGKFSGYNFHVPTILGTIICMSTMPSGKPSKHWLSMATGYAAHYFIGIIFAFVYGSDTIFSLQKIGYENALHFGLVAGIVAILFWFSVLKLHPLAPAVNIKPYLIFIFVGHLIFSFSMHFTFISIQHFSS